MEGSRMLGFEKILETGKKMKLETVETDGKVHQSELEAEWITSTLF